MRRIIFAAIVTLGLANNALAACDVEEQLITYLKAHAPDRAQILALDHATRRWSGYSWIKPNLTKTREGFENLSLAKPRVLNGKDPLIVVVTNTNTLLYTVAQTAAIRVDSAELAALQALALNLGGVLQFATVADGQREVLSNLESVTMSRVDTADETNRFNAFKIETVPIKVLPRDLEVISATFVEALEAEADKLAQPLTDLRVAAASLKSNVDLATTRGSSLNSLIQVIEAGQTPSNIPPHGPADLLLPQTIESDFSNLVTELALIRDVETLCVAESGAALTAVGHKRFGFPADSRRKEAARKEFDEALDALTSAGGKSCDGETRDAMRLLGRWLAAAPPTESPAPDAQQEALMNIENAALRFATIGSKTSAAIEKASEALKEQFKPVQTAARVVQVAKKLENYDPAKPCTLSAGVIEVDRRNDTIADLPFGKEGEETFVISANPSFPDIEKNHAVPIEVSYGIAKQRRFDFDVDVSLVYTSLLNPTFGVQEVVDPNAPAGSSKQYKIIRKSEKSRAGDLAAMLTFKGPGITSIVQPQIGAGVTADQPAFFTGLAIPLGPYFKLSGGWTWQKVTKLANGQKEGDPISGEDALSTRDGFGDSWYVSLSITLDNIPFFKRP